MSSDDNNNHNNKGGFWNHMMTIIGVTRRRHSGLFRHATVRYNVNRLMSEKLDTPPRRHQSVRKTTMPRKSRYFYVTIDCGPAAMCFSDLPQIYSRLSPEGRSFSASILWIAVPILTEASATLLISRDQPGRYMHRRLTCIKSTAKVTDLAWDPFNPNYLAIAMVSGEVQFWLIREDTDDGDALQPNRIIQVGYGRVSCLCFNPVAMNIFAVATDGTQLSVWSSEHQQRVVVCNGHVDQILSVAWDPTGTKLVTVSKDQCIRLYDPRISRKPLKQSVVLESPKNARCLFTCNGRCILISAFNRFSQRTVSLYRTDSFHHLITIPFDSSPQLLIPDYDYDSSVLFLTGRGDQTIHMYEVQEIAPYFLQLMPCKLRNNHQAITLLPKHVCKVSDLEFATGYRLHTNWIEPISFKIPRNKANTFHQDLFPDSLVTWEPTLTADEWIDGASKPLLFVTLKPNDAPCSRL